MIPMALCLLLAAPLTAQTADSTTQRPRLPSASDTNDAQAYYALGLEQLRRRPEDAAAAFYWATRIDPECAGCVYGRAIAEALTDGENVRRYWFGVPETLRLPRYVAVDSLRRLAMMMDPFLFRRIDATLIAGVANVRFGSERRFEEILMSVDSGMAALVLYSGGRFAQALDTWAGIANRSPRNALVRVQRARAFFLQQRYDSARAQMAEAIGIVRARDADSIRFVYESKASWEFSLGRIYHVLNQPDSARAAFQRALEEDLSYSPAHIQLGQLHLERGDTAAALREFSLAVAARENDYVPRITYGFELAKAGRLDSAEVQARRAIEMEPYAARPRMLLGVILDTNGDAAAALEAYSAFLGRAAANDEYRSSIVERVAALRAR